MTDIIVSIRKTLKKSADDKTKASFRKFFKEEVQGYGVKTWTVDKIAKEYLSQTKNLSKEEIFSLCEQLMKSNLIEESWIAASWAYSLRKFYERKDFTIFEHWVTSYVSNWATCDTLCNHTLGAFMELYPEFIEKIKTWTHSENRWMKRASAVTFILPARNGKFLEDILDIAGMLLLDKDDMVQKGYGWMLKEASRKHQREIFNFVMKHKKEMPRTALRYAIEKIPPELKKRAMEK